MKLTLFRIGCLLHALSMGIICVLGIVAPSFAMSNMTGMDHAWDPSTLSLMRMQTGGDLGLAIGFALIAYRPVSSFSAFLLCATASIGHGLVHLILATHDPANELMMIAVLIGAPIVLALLYPFSRGVAFYREQQEPNAPRSWILRGTCVAFGLMMVGIGMFGLADAARAMTYMAGEAHAWQPQTLSLMRMHTAADVGLGLGLFAAAYRPSASFAALILGTLAASAHGTTHLLEEVEGFHPSDNATPLFLLGAVLLLLVIVTPWKQLFARYAAAA